MTPFISRTKSPDKPFGYEAEYEDYAQAIADSEGRGQILAS